MNDKNRQRFDQLGLNIAYYRKQKKITQEQLAEKTGISRTHMSNIESLTASCPPSLRLVFKIAYALDIGVEKLFDNIE